MPSFSARLHLPGQTRLPLSVEVDISDERMRLTAGDREVADWPMADVVVVVQSDGFHLTVENEEVVLIPADSAGFAEVMGVGDPTGSRKGSTRALDSATLKQVRHDFLKARVAEIAALMTSSSVPPEEVFAQWLSLLKDINRRHGSGSIPTHVFYELNTQLLDLIPEPSETTGAASPAGPQRPM